MVFGIGFVRPFPVPPLRTVVDFVAQSVGTDNAENVIIYNIIRFLVVTVRTRTFFLINKPNNV